MTRTDCSLPTSSPSTAPPNSPEAVRDQVRAGYAEIAVRGSWCPDAATPPGTPLTAAPPAEEPAALSGCGCGPGGCCGGAAFTPEELAKAIGYSDSELAAAPTGANMGLSCGNPTALAALRPGEVVLDLGAGGGFDCFIAGSKVGAAGRAIGVDMTAEMVGKARANLAHYVASTGLRNVEFRLGEIEHLPAADASVDVVISNCVLNLSPDKPAVWREIARVLKPGGRVAISDLALVRPLPSKVLERVEALIGCVSGAVLVEESRAMAEAAGLKEIVLTQRRDYVDAMMNFEDPLYQRIVEDLPAGATPGDYVVSLEVTARKAAPCCCSGPC